MSGFRDDEVDGLRKALPVGSLSFELFAAAAGEAVELGLAASFAFGPFGGNPAVLLQAVEGWIERALLYLQNLFRYLLYPFGDGPSMLRLVGEGAENEKVESALNKIVRLAHTVIIYNTSVDSQGIVCIRLARETGGLLIKAQPVSSNSTPGPSRHNGGMRRAAMVLLFTTIASAQALLSPSEAERERQRFASRSDEVALKCEVTPVAPTVNLSFRTEAGYIFHVPRRDSRLSGGWTVFTAITPEQGKPAYLLAHNSPAQTTNTGSNFDIPGAYFLGAGHYSVEATIREGDHLMCRQHWKVDVAPPHGDRGIPLAIAPSTIEDYAHAGLPISGHADDVPPMRITILLDAAAFSHRRTVIIDRDRERMTQSLTALVEHLPAAILSITAFSLEQQREIFHAKAFGPQDLVRLNTAIAANPQASVDVDLLHPHGPTDYLMALVGRILRTTGEGDTVIFLGPTSRYRDGLPKDALPAAESYARFFYVRYESVAPLASDGVETYINLPVDPRTGDTVDAIRVLNGTTVTYPGTRVDPVGVSAPTRAVDPSYGQPDIISKVVTLLNGKNFIVHSAAEFADAIRKIEGRR
jgi:hypothetical protein